LDEVTADCTKHRSEELHNVHSSPNIIRLIKSKWRRKRWARHVARMGEKRDVYRVLAGKPEGDKPLGDLDGKIILKCALNILGEGGVIWFRIGTSHGLL
jgi:hypothetical protein